ncbi:MAG TPA: hypothetical protein VJZ27_16675 [Aggregatilineales bacterium]|nr:hypothetical protein [Aggregatilineales bacterium]
MSEENSGIQVEPIDGYNALKLICKHNIDDHDLHGASQQILAALDRTTAPLHLVVDLTSQPELPVGATTYEILTGPIKNPLLGKFLVFGSSPSAHLVADFVEFRGTVEALWFDTEAEAMAYLDQIGGKRDTD